MGLNMWPFRKNKVNINILNTTIKMDDKIYIGDQFYNKHYDELVLNLSEDGSLELRMSSSKLLPSYLPQDRLFILIKENEVIRWREISSWTPRKSGTIKFLVGAGGTEHGK